MKSNKSIMYNLKLKSVCFLASFSLLIFSNSCTKLEQQESISPSSPSSAKVAATGIPNAITLFCPGNTQASRSEFSGLTRWYTESGGQTQVFKLYNGDAIPRGSDPTDIHARSEVGGGFFFKEGATWHTFEARMKISKPLNESLCIAQLFASTKGPQLMVHLRSNGNLDYGSRSNGNGVIETGNWADGRTFKVKIRSNGKNWELYINNSRKATGITEESQLGNNTVDYNFRWGIYYNFPMYTFVTNTVTEIVRE
jgi:Alginate lyase